MAVRLVDGVSSMRWLALVAVVVVGFSACSDSDDDALALPTSEPATTVGADGSGADLDVDPLRVTSDDGKTTATAGSSSTGSTSSTSTSSTSSTTTSSTTSTLASSTSSTVSTTTSAPKTTSTTRSTTTAPTTGGGSCRTSATKCVGPGQQFSTLAAAVQASSNGDVIELVVGRYNETVAVTANDVTIRSSPGGRATIDCSGMRPARGKACVLAIGTNLTVEDMVVTGARGPDNNEACFRNEPGTRFIVRRIECYGSNNGILGSGGSWLIEDAHFHDNGAGDGFSHNLYLSGDCSEVVFRRSTSERAVGGHAFKSRCRTSTIEASTLRDNTVADAAEFSYGGEVVIRNSTLHQPNGDNGNIVRHGAEGCRHSGALTIVDSTISSDRSQAYIRSACQPVVLQGTALPPGVTVSQP